ncbi:hypothetical protein B0H19DRAFT_1263242 [Mycena capillaripes]|nr:hypothetical protein B0H19DRAFT_1263242 [Mycena capillaripes]
MILESGAIYCATVILGIITSTFCDPASPFSNIVAGALSQVVNIAPTLIIVRVGLGQHGRCEVCKDSDASGVHMLRVQGSGSGSVAS